MNKRNEGEILFAEGKIEEAVKYFLFEAENGSNRKEAYNNLGVIAFQDGHSEKAIDYFTRSLEIDPLYKDAVINYTRLLKTLNQVHIAIPLLEQITEIKPNDKDILQLLENIRTTSQSRLKIAVLCSRGFDSFLEDIVNHLKASHDVRTCYTNNELEIHSCIEWADIVWLEFANDISVYVTNKVSAIHQKKVVCRIHKYEALVGLLSQIEWNKIDKAIFVADHIREIAYETCPSIARETDCIVINNGVNLQKFSYKKRKPGYNIAVVGHINNKKNPSMWVEILNRLATLNPQYKIKIVGDGQEILYKYYFENIIPKLGLEKNIEFFGKTDDIPSWFEREGINYLLTTSVCESFGYGIAEAMAMGYKPLIHNFPHSEDIWPHHCIFSSTDELIEIINDNYNSHEYHEFVESRYSLSSQLDAIDDMLISLNNESHTQITTDTQMENEVNA